MQNFNRIFSYQKVLTILKCVVFKIATFHKNSPKSRELESHCAPLVPPSRDLQPTYLGVCPQV